MKRFLAKLKTGTEMDKFYVINKKTGKIHRMTVNEMNSNAASGEFIWKKGFEKKYKDFLQKGAKSDIRRAIHFLANEDPDDTFWGSSGKFNPKSEKFKQIEKALYEDHLQGKIILEERKDIHGNPIFFAENIVWVKWAIERGFNDTTPELFIEHSQTFPFQSISKQALNKEIIDEDLTLEKTLRKEDIKKPKRRRHDSSLRELIKEMYLTTEDKSSDSIWNQLKKRKNEFDFIDSIDSRTDHDPKICWFDAKGRKKTFRWSSFDNEITKLNNQYRK